MDWKPRLGKMKNILIGIVCCLALWSCDNKETNDFMARPFWSEPILLHEGIVRRVDYIFDTNGKSNCISGMQFEKDYFSCKVENPPRGLDYYPLTANLGDNLIGKRMSLYRMMNKNGYATFILDVPNINPVTGKTIKEK